MGGIREGLGDHARRREVQTRCKPGRLWFAAKLLKRRGYGANCNPYFRRGASDVERECPPHTKSPGRNHAIEIGTGFF